MRTPLYLLAGGMKKATRSATGNLLEQALLSAGTTSPTVAYLGSASGDNRGFCSMMTGFLRDAGAGRVLPAPTVSSRVSMEKTTRILSDADVVFVGGGDVEAGMDIIAKRCLDEVLTGLYKSGKPFIGISAGSIMLGRSWVRWKDADDDRTASIFPCLGLAPLICDTHAEEDDWEELRTLVRLSEDGTVGYGIPSGAGILVSGEITALGGPVARYKHSRGEVRRLVDM